jgi:hypothetical protein
VGMSFDDSFVSICEEIRGKFSRRNDSYESNGKVWSFKVLIERAKCLKLSSGESYETHQMKSSFIPPFSTTLPG